MQNVKKLGESTLSGTICHVMRRALYQELCGELGGYTEPYLHYKFIK